MTQQKGGLSICIPNWNHRNYLARSLLSAIRACDHLARHSISSEIIVVDDYSRDGSLRLLLSSLLQEDAEHVRVVAHTENLGLAAARNTALRASRYDFICFMDADNELVPENIHLFYRAILATGAALVYGNLMRMHDNEPDGFLSNELINIDIYHLNYIDAFALIDAGKIRDAGCYYGKHAAAHEDWELLLHLIAEGEKIVFVPAVLGLYHTAELSMITEVEFDHSKMRRVFNQRKSGLPSGFAARIIYHPAIGYL